MSDTELTPSGRKRREEILKMAIQLGRQRRRQQLAVRGGAVAVVLLAIGVAGAAHCSDQYLAPLICRSQNPCHRPPWRRIVRRLGRSSSSAFKLIPRSPRGLPFRNPRRDGSDWTTIIS